VPSSAAIEIRERSGKLQGVRYRKNGGKYFSGQKKTVKGSL
jgi:hypothetical protein